MSFRAEHRAFCVFCSKSPGLGRLLISRANLAPRVPVSGKQCRAFRLILKLALGPCLKRLPVWRTSFWYGDAVRILWCRNRLGCCNNGQRSTKSAIAGGFEGLFRQTIPLGVISKAIIKSFSN